MEEATEPGDETPLTGPPREAAASVPRVQPPPPRITSLSPPRPPSSQPQQQQQPPSVQSSAERRLQQRENLQPERRPSREPKEQNENMGTVLSFSPRERHGSGLSQSPGLQTGGQGAPGQPNFTLNNYNYEQLNNVKNRENKGMGAQAATQQPPAANNNSLQNNNINLNNNDNARIISEKNALEKNIKKNSLIIGALSWKRFSTVNNNKKKMDNNKNKNIKFRQPLDNIPITDKNKNIQTPQVSFARADACTSLFFFLLR